MGTCSFSFQNVGLMCISSCMITMDSQRERFSFLLRCLLQDFPGTKEAAAWRYGKRVIEVEIGILNHELSFSGK